MHLVMKHPLGHASIEDRALFRQQLAVLMERAPNLAAPPLAGLDPIERRFVESELRAREILARLQQQVSHG